MPTGFVVRTGFGEALAGVEVRNDDPHLGEPSYALSGVRNAHCAGVVTQP